VTRRVFTVLATLSLSACATVPTSVQLPALQAFALSEVAFNTLKSSAIVLIENGTITGSTKATLITLVDQAQQAETLGAQAVAAGDATNIATEAQALATLTSEIDAIVHPPKGS
jgi:hypothetical protein